MYFNTLFNVYGLFYREVDHESAVREYIRREGEAPAPEDLYHKSKQMPPRFKTEIKSLIHLKENEPIHFECKLVPIGDPHMNVEWFKDGQPLQYGKNFFCRQMQI